MAERSATIASCHFVKPGWPGNERRSRLVLANVVAAVPGRIAARTPTALLLRAEQGWDDDRHPARRRHAAG
jgi:hypothetical protein